MKTCIKCEIEKPFEDFGKVSKNKDGLNSKCKECKRKYDNKYHKNRNNKSKKRKQELQTKRLKEGRKYVLEYLKDKKCKNCTENRIPALDFHHLRNKEFNIADGVRKGYSLNRIKKEIEKCEVMCANCHRIVTAEEQGWYNI